MKKIILLCSFLFMFVAANAQKHQHLSLNEFQKGKPTNSFEKKQTGLPNPKSLTWKWDTIITYDTNNTFLEMHTRQFDPIANKTTILIKRWISGIWQDNERFTYTYNTNNDTLTWLREYQNGITWLNSNKNIYVYNAAGSLLSELDLLWSYTIWRNTQRFSYTYDSSENKLTELQEFWQNDTCKNKMRTFYSYDINGNNNLLWDEVFQGGIWVKGFKDTLTFDSNGKILIYINEMFSNGSWINNEKNENFYDINGNLLNYDVYGWDIINGWYMSDKNIFTYDNSGNMLTELWSSRMWGSGWKDIGKNTYTYDMDNNMVLKTFENWNDIIGSWNNASRYNFSYDANKNTVSENIQNWIINSWEPIITTCVLYSNKEIVYYVYDCYRYEAHFTQLNSCSANFQLYPDTLVPHQYYIVNMAFGIPPVSYIWSWGDGNFDYTALPSHTYDSVGSYTICLTITDGAGCTTTYCDSSYLAKNTNAMVSVDVVAPLGVRDNEINKTISIYPNPVTTTLIIVGFSKTATAEVYDISGKLLLTKQLYTHQLDISSLANGLYFIKLTTNEGNVVRKIVKE